MTTSDDLIDKQRILGRAARCRGGSGAATVALSMRVWQDVAAQSCSTTHCKSRWSKVGL